MTKRTIDIPRAIKLYEITRDWKQVSAILSRGMRVPFNVHSIIRAVWLHDNTPPGDRPYEKAY